MVDVLTHITINRPRHIVAKYAMNPDNAPEWYVNIEFAEWKTEKPLRVGSQIAFVAHFLGRELSYVYEIVEYIPNEKLVMRTADGPFEMETTYLFETVDEHTTRMILQNKGNPTGFSKFIAPFMSLAMKRANTKDLILLKELLEYEAQEASHADAA